MKNYWVIHNYPDEHYEEERDTWSYYKKHGRWLLSLKSPNTKKLKKGDIAILRIYGVGYCGTFEFASSLERDKKLGEDGGWVKIRNVKEWEPPLPKPLVEDQLKAKGFRTSLVKSSEKDKIIIESAQTIYKKMGLGSKSTKDIIILEKGLEEAIKPSLRKLGLKVLDDKRGQQFSTEAGRSDLLCEDKKGTLIIVEIKRGPGTSDEVVGQC